MPRPVHFEIPAHDVARAMKFFSTVFGWSFVGWEGGDYQLATTGAEGEMGIDGAIAKRANPEQGIVNSINVSSVDEYAAKVTANGGTMIVPKMPVPGMGWIAYFTDTEGNTHGLWQTDPEAK